MEHEWLNWTAVRISAACWWWTIFRAELRPEIVLQRANLMLRVAHVVAAYESKCDIECEQQPAEQRPATYARPHVDTRSRIRIIRFLERRREAHQILEATPDGSHELRTGRNVDAVLEEPRPRASRRRRHEAD